jgi:hypothetical protein
MSCTFSVYGFIDLLPTTLTQSCYPFGHAFFLGISLFLCRLGDGAKWQAFPDFHWKTRVLRVQSGFRCAFQHRTIFGESIPLVAFRVSTTSRAS